jgi:pSer/pThr/pTyr-binding forkhead associated (FHA) protein
MGDDGTDAALVLATGECFALKAGDNLVGRKDGGAGVDIDLEPFDPDKYTSRKHCLLSLEGGRLFVTDLSANGTWLRGVRLEKGARTAAFAGNAIKFVGVEGKLRL